MYMYVQPVHVLCMGRDGAATRPFGRAPPRHPRLRRDPRTIRAAPAASPRPAPSDDPRGARRDLPLRTIREAPAGTCPFGRSARRPPGPAPSDGSARRLPRRPIRPRRGRAPRGPRCRAGQRSTWRWTRPPVTAAGPRRRPPARTCNRPSGRTSTVSVDFLRRRQARASRLTRISLDPRRRGARPGGRGASSNTRFPANATCTSNGGECCVPSASTPTTVGLDAQKCFQFVALASE